MDTMAPKSVPSSEEVRMKGNELYKNGKITEAVLFYTRATELSPDERAPWTNLSAAYFELGNYTKAVSACDTALSLLNPDATDYESIKQKHVVRRAKSCLFLGRFEDAAALADTADGPLMDSEDMLAECVKCYVESTRRISDTVKARNELILNLPRFKPTLISTAEYYPIGHDTPESLYDIELSRSLRPTVSFLLGGIGDARNLFHTLIQVARQDRKSIPDARKFYHFTIVDIKPSAIARDLVILLLLDELSKLSDSPDEVEKSTLLLCLFYTYTTSIMPSSLHDLLQEKIAQATTALVEDTLPSYIEIPSMYRAEILRYLEDWQNIVQHKYPITRVQHQIVQTRAREEQEHIAFGGSASAINLPSGTALAKERLFDSLTGAVMLPSPHSKLLSPDLHKAFNSFDARSPHASVKEAVGVIRKTWSTNVTLVDLAWEQSRDPDPFMDIDVGENPYSFCNKMIEAGFKPSRGKSLFDHAAPWFISIAQALRLLKDRMLIEACVGDVVAVLEQIKYGAVGHRQPLESPGEAMQAQAPGYPQMYDRIHLSNVPDYIGGSLTSYMYALQMTFPGKDSYITSTCLRNPPRFETVASFDAEYVGMYTESDLEKLFHVRMKPNFDAFMPMCAYNRWHHHIASSKYRDLMPRAKLETWLYRLLLKVAIPLERRMIVDNQLIYSPLNLTFFFRLCEHLHTIGYPAHWLSDILSSILSGSIITTARPPRSEPLKLREIDAARKALAQSVAPFKAEFSTLAAMWQLLLPFGILSSDIAPVESIKEYSAYFKQVSGEVIAYPNFVIVFYKGTLPMSVKYGLRKALLSDERGNKEYDELREHCMHIISTWSWHRDSQTAKLWLREDVMDKMRGEDWQVCIYRTDDWRPQSSAYHLSSARVKEIGPSWVERVNRETGT